MSDQHDRNRQAGAPVAQSTGDDATVARAARSPAVHYEADPDQLVKVVHQVEPVAVPLQGPVGDGFHEGVDDAGVTDVAVTPEEPSVRDARPVDP